ncbi:threonylcarbamoyl-AMP synthase [Candidatus Micrarchaeota archaeon CG1_02_51_15]|nr:MAG: threonylcarbamoyl-AMP synthase [Candidatus Micrarchaeota archaeon CG1_02_51_15]
MRTKKGETPVLAIPADRRDREKLMKVIEHAAKVIRDGGVVVTPTETSYAFAVDATNESALKKVIELKSDSLEKRGISIIVSDLRMAREYGELAPEAEFLVQSFMPGPLTLIVERKNLPSCISDSGVAFGISSNVVARLLAQESELPITATGVHPAGQLPVYKIDEVKQRLNGKVDLILDAGNLVPLMSATVVDLRGGQPVAVREGPLAVKEIFSQLDYFRNQAAVFV